MLGGRHELKVKDGKATKVGKNSPVEDLVALVLRRAEGCARARGEAQPRLRQGADPGLGLRPRVSSPRTASKGMTVLGLDFLPPAEVKALVKGPSCRSR
ncbi:MAG: hypothetical protein U1F43_19625 [Myxococcota bacterium]